MNFTSYEISKQRHEAGFKAETNTLAHPTESIFGEKYLAYDLGTLLNAMPKKIMLEEPAVLHLGWRSDILPTETVWMIGYANQKLDNFLISELQEPNESLTDLVARLLLRLIKIKKI